MKVANGFAFLCDRRREAGMIVRVILIVADVEFEREVGTQRNEAVKDGVVTNGPRNTA